MARNAAPSQPIPATPVCCGRNDPQRSVLPRAGEQDQRRRTSATMISWMISCRGEAEQRQHQSVAGGVERPECRGKREPLLPLITAANGQRPPPAGVSRETGRMPEADQPEPASSEAAPELRTVIIGVISAPGTCTELAERLRPDLTEGIGARLPSVRWVVRLVSDRLVDGPADLSQLISAARRRLIDEEWHLTVCVTDLPLQTARRPVVAHASMTDGVRPTGSRRWRRTRSCGTIRR